jgi:hypothetical protein
MTVIIPPNTVPKIGVKGSNLPIIKKGIEK